MQPQEDMVNILTTLLTLLWLGSTFSNGTLPTMHSIYLYTDIYKGLDIYIYIYICFFMVNNKISQFK